MRRSRIENIAISSAVALVLLLPAVPVSATSTSGSTHIFGTVCGETGPSPAITVTEPTSGHLFSVLPITVKGTVVRISQILISVDGVADSTLPIGATDQTFQTSLRIPPGTHTVELLALDVCQVANQSATLTVSYQPPAPTDNSNQTSSAPLTVNADGPAPPPGATIAYSSLPLQSVPVIGQVVKFGYAVTEALDFETRSPEAWGMSAFRFISVSTGLFFLLAVARLRYTIWRMHYRRLLDYQSYMDSKLYRKPERVVNMIGALLIVLVFVI